MADPIIDRIDAVLAEEPDDIDALVDAALAVGEPEWAGDWERYPEVCPHCGYQWHGLPSGLCEGSTFIGPMPSGTPATIEHGTACTCDDEPELDDIWPGC